MQDPKYPQAELKKIAQDYAEIPLNTVQDQFFFEEPFKHLVVDNFLPTPMMLSCSNAFPNPDDLSWEVTNDQDVEIKYRTDWKSEFDIPEGLIDVIRVLNSAPILKAMGDRIG